VVGKRGKNQCQSEQVDGSDLCAHHLADAAREFHAIAAASISAHIDARIPAEAAT
jgi:hypothetical protein